MTATEAIDLLETFRAGKVSREKVLRAFQTAPLVDLGFAQVDTHRALRKGFPEVVFGAGKTPLQVVQIAAKIFEREQRILVTRINGEHVRALRRKFKNAIHHQASRCVTIEKSPLPKRPGTIAVLCDDRFLLLLGLFDDEGAGLDEDLGRRNPIVQIAASGD